MELGMAALPKTSNPTHMLENLELNFAISKEDMTLLRNLDFKNYGEHSFSLCLAENKE